MKKQTKIILGVCLFAIVIMAIGYANVTTTTLTISGTASSAAEQSNFKVYFTGANTVKNPNDNTVTVTAAADSTTATVNFTGLKQKDDIAYAILEVENKSVGIDASSVNVTATGADTNFFDIEATMCTSDGRDITEFSVSAGAKTYVKVSAKLLQTPTSDVSTGINVTIEATPKANV